MEKFMSHFTFTYTLQIKIPRMSLYVFKCITDINTYNVCRVSLSTHWFPMDMTDYHVRGESCDFMCRREENSYFI